jgi:transcriptional regulator with XRE-family HTH domain
LPSKPTDAAAARVLASRIGGRCRLVREHRGMTQAQVAEKIGLATEAYARIERGLSLPSMTTLVRIASMHRVPVGDLLQAAPGESPLLGAFHAEHADAPRFQIVRRNPEPTDEEPDAEDAIHDTRDSRLRLRPMTLPRKAGAPSDVELRAEMGSLLEGLRRSDLELLLAFARRLAEGD